MMHLVRHVFLRSTLSAKSRQLIFSPACTTAAVADLPQTEDQSPPPVLNLFAIWAMNYLPRQLLHDCLDAEYAPSTPQHTRGASLSKPAKFARCFARRLMELWPAATSPEGVAEAEANHQDSKRRPVAQTLTHGDDENDPDCLNVLRLFFGHKMATSRAFLQAAEKAGLHKMQGNALGTAYHNILLNRILFAKDQNHASTTKHLAPSTVICCLNPGYADLSPDLRQCSLELQPKDIIAPSTACKRR